MPVCCLYICLVPPRCRGVVAGISSISSLSSLLSLSSSHIFSLTLHSCWLLACSTTLQHFLQMLNHWHSLCCNQQLRTLWLWFVVIDRHCHCLILPWPNWSWVQSLLCPNRPIRCPLKFLPSLSLSSSEHRAPSSLIYEFNHLDGALHLHHSSQHNSNKNPHQYISSLAYYDLIMLYHINPSLISCKSNWPFLDSKQVHSGKHCRAVSALQCRANLLYWHEINKLHWASVGSSCTCTVRVGHYPMRTSLVDPGLRWFFSDLLGVGEVNSW